MSTNDRGPILEDRFLSELLGLQAYCVSSVSASRVDNAFSALLRSPGTFVYAKVSTVQTIDVHWLEEQGFRVVDVLLTFSCSHETLKAKSWPPVRVRLADQSDEASVVALAREAFYFTRFHLDPRIDSKTASEIKAQWAANYFKGLRGDEMVVAEVDGQVAGFVQLLHKSTETHATIDLIATRTRFQRKGVARAMISFLGARFSGIDSIVVGTQAANTASVRLYESMGFRLRESAYVLHFHSHC